MRYHDDDGDDDDDGDGDGDGEDEDEDDEDDDEREEDGERDWQGCSAPHELQPLMKRPLAPLQVHHSSMPLGR